RPGSAPHVYEGERYRDGNLLSGSLSFTGMLSVPGLCRRRFSRSRACQPGITGYSGLSRADGSTTGLCRDHHSRVVSILILKRGRMARFLPFHVPDIGEEEVLSVTETLRSGWLTTGSKTKQFEAEFAKRIG